MNSNHNPFAEISDAELLASELAPAITVSREEGGAISVVVKVTAEFRIPAQVLLDNGGDANTVGTIIHERMTLDNYEVCAIIAAKLRAL